MLTTIRRLVRHIVHRLAESARTAPLDAMAGSGSRAARDAYLVPSQTKPHQIKPSKNAWIYLVLFVRIWTFQWVTSISK
jgi:hypothetical protein